MLTEDFNYSLPPELIAQTPTPHRDQSRLLVVNRATEELSHRQFPDLKEYIKPGDVLVLNNSRVIPARLRASNARTSGQFEILLVEQVGINDWWAMMRPGKRAPVGTEIHILDLQKQVSGISANVSEVNAEGHRRLQFSGVDNVLNHLDALGELPLPPYIERPAPKPEDLQRYQTVYAQTAGSVAAPTAGLHFTQELLSQLQERGVKICYVTLHVGLGTFAPVKAEDISGHIMHSERFELSEETAREIRAAKEEKRRVIAVGTTSVRVLESVARMNSGVVVPGSGKTDIFLFPPATFHIVDALVTNFHLPCSTLLMLVSAFASPGELQGRELVLQTYEEAIRQRYRFFSYGDAMFVH